MRGYDGGILSGGGDIPWHGFRLKAGMTVGGGNGPAAPGTLQQAAERHDLVRLAVIEDSEFLRTRLRVALEASGHMEVVGEFALSEEAVSAVERLRPDVVLLGMRRPDLNRSAAICRQIRGASSLTKVLVLSPGPWEDEALTSILSGASGHVSMDVPG